MAKLVFLGGGRTLDGNQERHHLGEALHLDEHIAGLETRPRLHPDDQLSFRHRGQLGRFKERFHLWISHQTDFRHQVPIQIVEKRPLQAGIRGTQDEFVIAFCKAERSKIVASM